MEDRTEPESGGGPVMLALSTFRRSDAAVELAMERAEAVGRLVIVFVADQNLARYLIETDIGMYPGLKGRYEEEVLQEHERHGARHAEEIAERARARGLEATTHVERGRFAHVCLAVAERENPSRIVTTRSNRPAWVKKLFGSPVDYLIEHVECPVEEA